MYVYVSIYILVFCVVVQGRKQILKSYCECVYVCVCVCVTDFVSSGRFCCFSLSVIKTNLGDAAVQQPVYHVNIN